MGEVPEGCAPGTYELVRKYVVANLMDGDEHGRFSFDGTDLADTIAELFSCENWRRNWNDALMDEFRALIGGEGHRADPGS